ncbi:GNAT family N-acetyltransferase [Ornithinibacillus scapharcae]|uniref:GNAT family N-acetyltransferase n=1 Tax=Ornithinibacillus scapharcae TaxID=1147159 RepID=UPI000225B839|nr:GNAT family N-acetyltransferase [Ornithinibacillus scapharcae]
MNVRIERAIRSDAESLVEIYHDAYSENERLGLPASASTVMVEEVREWIDKMILYVALDKHTDLIMGTVRLNYQKDWNCYVLSRLAVRSSFKGKGIASQLINFMEKYLLRIGEQRVRLTVAQTHPYLPHMYEKKGYKVIGERILEDLPYNEYIMEKILAK